MLRLFACHQCPRPRTATESHAKKSGSQWLRKEEPPSHGRGSTGKGVSTCTPSRGTPPWKSSCLPPGWALPCNGRPPNPPPVLLRPAHQSHSLPPGAHGHRVAPDPRCAPPAPPRPLRAPSGVEILISPVAQSRGMALELPQTRCGGARQLRVSDNFPTKAPAFPLSPASWR